eukprot:TRINITY_DN22864_c0_g1_i1.p1 TRINITY_DN22864_c0_g1~~TRINITY_DN22864_c0_g1_i1.p1  ORF type:complete len:664 (+),score=79.26 TRINITY_DN22864_c0_g1_i1:103-2094(+)
MVYIEGGITYPGTRPNTNTAERPLPPETTFRSRITAQPDADFPAATGRYHLIVSYACPWASRTIILRAIKGLQDAITMDVVHPLKEEATGWHFVTTPEGDPAFPECRPDRVKGAKYLSELYLAADSQYTGKVTVPVLWDTVKGRIVNNESAEIMEMLNWEFDVFSTSPQIKNFFPVELKKEMSEVDEVVATVNNGVFRCGFTTSQEAYESACLELFAALNKLEDRLSISRYLVGDSSGAVPPSPTLSDWRLFTTLIRFDAVYYLLFKCNLRRLKDYPKLQGYLEDLYTFPGVADTVIFSHIRAAYYKNFPAINPKGLIPKGGLPWMPIPPFTRRVLGLPEANEQKGEKTQEKGVEGPGLPLSGATAPVAVHGAFVRPTSNFRKRITADGSSGLKAEAGRYHLYLANNCPWCHRVALTRSVLGLEETISLDVVSYRRDPQRGWQFKPEIPGCTADTVNGGIGFIGELYQRMGSPEKSVPVLWDKQTGTIVNNESSEIIRMLAQEFSAFHRSGAPELVPAHLEGEIDQVNAWVYDGINNGAYKAGFASSQGAYELAFDGFFRALDRAELRLSRHRYLVGQVLTEADIRLFPTIFRFDYVYYMRFMLNRDFIVDAYPNLQRWMLDVYALPGIAKACNMEHCREGYFGRTGNNLVPLGPRLPFSFDP